ncbi:hypothetical protein LINPERPRIM_LOCUS21323 [Linum perenne]
MCIINLFF